jgi:hypothetical protein
MAACPTEDKGFVAREVNTFLAASRSVTACVWGAGGGVRERGHA